MKDVAVTPTTPQTPVPALLHLGGAARPGLCTDCGVSRMGDGKACGRACQFIAPNYPALERAVHGRVARDAGDEAFFGVTLSMQRARLSPPAPGAQWTGLTTAIAARLLETGAVDAVLTVAPDPQDRWKPRPVIVTDPEALAACRGMRMGYAPLLAALEPARAAGHRRLAVIGIPCQVYALRALEAELDFDALTVIGTPCSDNTTTENFHHFLSLLDPAPETISYLEFRTDFRVELRFDDGRAPRCVPFLSLPISDLPADFFPMTCKTCVDYTNRLADLTVGYMGGDGDQWVIARNERGAAALAGLGDRLSTRPLTDRGKRTGAVRGFLANTERAAGGMPLRRMPDWLRPLVSFLQPRIGPRGLEFARARVEMKAVETVLHLRRAHPARIKNMVPAHVWRLVAAYGLSPRPEEAPARSEPTEVNPDPSAPAE
ncbi:coenzyme F420 hydrogenase [Meridianimarinicoccus roseus]|uniref:Coenzyme F420 hydrogenase n=1 Tax=Meridianimarinicoccus roseus TaxID=2072018 RepID=A0A2V2LEU5_9RHOB|nr:Coenzyme F420 hydrogenase/dehydrogenase, beta subunit C-terminal domain [Meridianimarinicoccus roseus]PWR01756.1 coenzyme F420 hydrogenase [Meridianimarinicoccus roseus]